MSARSRHPRLVAIACAVYGLIIGLYPSTFRQAFGRELVVTFRSRVEDVLDGNRVHAWLAFSVHIAWDTLRTSAALAVSRDDQDSASFLGLSDGADARGGIDHAAVNIDLMFAVAGLVLGFAGWYAYFAILPSYVM
jgi:hypothetical protein